MKRNNSDYEGLSFTVEVTNNGFLLKNNNLTVAGWKVKQFELYDDLVEELARSTGLLQVGEKMNCLSTFKERNVKTS